LVTLASGGQAVCWRCAWIAAALSLLLGAGSLPDQAQGAAIAASQPRTHTVTIEATSFTPESLTVAAGDKVVWVNKDPFPHTATSSSGGLDSGSIEPDKSWTFTAAKKGEFSYICALHPTMKAVLKVE
jgi:plastocyanin